jgi:hypothetical protein
VRAERQEQRDDGFASIETLSTEAGNVSRCNKNRTIGRHSTLLCHDLLNALEALAGPPPAAGISRLRLLARIRALRAQMKTLHYALCLPE